MGSCQRKLKDAAMFGKEIDEHQFIVEHSAYDGPSLESQLVAHVEPMMEEDEQTSLGQTIDEERAIAQTTTREVIFANIGHQKVLGPDRTILQVTSGLVEHGVSSLMKALFWRLWCIHHL